LILPWPADVLQQQSNAVTSLFSLEEVQWFCFCALVTNFTQSIIIIETTNRLKRRVKCIGSACLICNDGTTNRNAQYGGATAFI
jgi:hypothetical protein